jgi:hypothetical protein
MALTLQGQVTPLFVKGATELATVRASLLFCLYLGTQVAFKDCHAPVLAMEEGGRLPMGTWTKVRGLMAMLVVSRTFGVDLGAVRSRARRFHNRVEGGCRVGQARY